MLGSGARCTSGLPWQAEQRVWKTPYPDRIPPGGPSEGVWACSAGYDLRLLFEFVQQEQEGMEAIFLLTIGTHDEVY